MNLYKEFKDKIRMQLKEKLGKENIHQVPQIEKVVVSMGIGSLTTRKSVKDFSDLESNLMKITGQKPVMIKSNKAISNFKLREGMPVMLKTTLRREKAYDFIDRLSKLVLPRVRDFEGVNPRSFDGKGNYNIGFKNQVVFPELSHEEIKTPHGVQVTITTTSDSNSDAKELLKSLGIIVKEK